jgi:lysophospholipase L1-like esterase
VRRLLPLVALALLAGCAQPASPQPATRTVVTLGDSVPAGAACGCEPFPSRYAQSQHAADVNLAEGGLTSAEVLAQVPDERDVLATAAETVIMVGANDLADAFESGGPFPPAAATVRTDVAATITEIDRIHPMPVIVLGYWNVVLDGQVAEQQYNSDEVRESAEATRYANDALRAAAQQTGATFVATEEAFHGDAGGQDPTGLLAPDGDHPNAAGQAAIAALIPPLPPAGRPRSGRG